MKILFFLVGACLFAESPDSGSQAAVAIIELAATYMQNGLPTSPKIAPNAIEGICNFEHSACSGAEVILFDSSGKEMKRQRILDGFKLQGLDKSQTYRLEVQYARYKASGSLAEVHPGRFIRIDITRSPKQ